MNGSGAEMVMTVDGIVEPYESPYFTMVEELVEFWDEDWGWIDCSDPPTLVVHDKGVPPHIKNIIEIIRPSGITVEYVDESNDTSCTDSGDGDDQNHIESKSFHEQMCELADDLDEKRREREEQRVNEYLREQREVFKAEITEVSKYHDTELLFKLDIPTGGTLTKRFVLPDGEGSGERLYEILDYLGATLRDMDMVEGMYLPVTCDDSGSWEIRLPSDEGDGYVGDGYIGTAVGLCKPMLSVSLPSYTTTVRLLSVLGLCMGLGGMIVTPDTNHMVDLMFLGEFVLSLFVGIYTIGWAK